ncbi:MAG: VWA domain-containing protein [Thermodesulfobacteriota bacterium]
MLRSCLVSTREGLAVFDRCFEEIFSPFLERPAPAVVPSLDTGPPVLDEAARLEETPLYETDEDQDIQPQAVGASLAERHARRDFARLEPGEAREVLREVRRLAKVLAGQIKRRLALAGRADRLDFRRTLRASLQTGGEPITLCFRAPKPRPRRLVFLGDVSGSMDLYTRFFLVFMHGLAEILPRTEAFVFSTRLVRVTRLLKNTPAEDILDKLARSGLPLSGGTNIGGAVDEFLRLYRSALSGHRCLCFIISDGWDRGESALLDRAMRRLRHLCAGIIWLNPLAADPGYEPLATGMATARPYLTALLPFSRLKDVKALSRRLDRLIF